MEDRGMRDDTSVAERPPASPVREPTVDGVRVSHPDRVVDPASGVTKLELVRYYEAVWDRMIEHLKSRPVALVRAPSGIGGELFFQRHDDGDPSAPIEIGDEESLLRAAQRNAVEFHTGGSTVRTERPDRIVFDLDPGEGIAWPQLQEAAAIVRAYLQELELEAWLKTSGGKGLHVVVPINSRWSADTVREFAKAAVRELARREPARFVAQPGAGHRVGRIFVDYMRNGTGAMTVAAFSARARPGLGVSMPISWAELENVDGAAHWTVANAADWVYVEKRDPWSGYHLIRQTLTPGLKALGIKSAPGSSR